jgi:hypothetical protein
MRHWFNTALIMPKLGALALLFALGACTLKSQPSTDNNPESLCASLHWHAANPASTVWYMLAQRGTSNLTNRGHTSNSALIRVKSDSGEQVWLLGQGPSPRWGQALRCSLAKQLGVAVTDTLSARAHPESVLGLVAFAPARTWAWPVVQQAMRERCPTCTPALAQASGDDSISHEQIRVPQYSVLTQESGGAAVPVARLKGLDVFAVRRATDDWTTLVRDQASGTWLAPGLVWGPGITPDLREASLVHMIAALEWLEQQGARQVVPEQGVLANAQVLAENLAYWRGMQAQIKQAIGAGQNLDNALMQQSMAGAAWQRIQSQADKTEQALNRERHNLNMQRAWRELEEAYFKAIQPK